jgi:hypothetical protein
MKFHLCGFDSRQWKKMLMLWAMLSISAMAQGIRGTISGQVTDPNGAGIPGAVVKLVDAARNQELRVVVANESGGYQFLEIEPTVYHIVVTATGFVERRINNIKVETNRNLRIDASLGVSGATAEVIVSAGQELVERESGALGTTVERRRVEGLPLNGRNVLNLALLQPGVVESNLNTTSTFDSGAGVRVNGQRGVENNVQLDGSNNNEVAVGGLAGPQPPPDAVEEFRLLTSNADAEFGRNTGSIINFVTRGGTRDFHGNARLFWRPTVLSAARYFDKTLPGARPLRGTDDFRRQFERKEFGGNLGGPVWIPGLYNGRERTFFFVDYEARRQLIGDTRTIQGLPSALERDGNFSALGRPLIDPATGQPFPGNIIPASRISPIAKYYLGFLPSPGAGGQTTVGANQPNDFNQLTARADHLLTNKQNLNYTFTWFDQTVSSPFAFGGASVPGFGSLDLRSSQNHVVRHTWAFTPSLINSLLVGYARNFQPGVAPQNATSPQEIGFTANFVANPGFAGPPQIRLFDRNLFLGNSSQGPQRRVSENFQIQNALSWAVGDHRFKFGFDGTHHRQDQTFVFTNQGRLTYSGQFGGNSTGDDFADLLIGNTPIASQFGANGERDFRQNVAGLFAQDTFRLNNSLTLSYGLRWEYFSPLTDKFNRVAFYRAGAVSQLLTSGQLRTPEGLPITVPAGGRAPVGLVFPGDPDPVLGGVVPDGGIAKDRNNIAPRFSLAWSPNVSNGFLSKLFGNRETVIRAGYGIFYGAITADTALQQLSAPGYNGTNAFFFPASGTLADPFAPDPYPNFGGNQGQNPNPFKASQVAIGAPLTQFSQAIDPNLQTPYTQQWNLTIERGFLRDYVFGVSYVGNRGLKQYAVIEVNPSLGTFFPTPAGRTIPAPTVTNLNARRLNPDIPQGVGMLSSIANSWYNALQINVQKRFGAGLLFQTAYTFSKSIAELDTSRGSLDTIDRRFGRSLSNDDVPHRFVASWLYELPFTRNLTGAWRRVFDGWGGGGIATFQSGTPFTVFNPTDTTGAGIGVLSFADLSAAFTQMDPRKNDNRAFNADAFKAFTVANLATGFRRGTAPANFYRLQNGVNNWDLIVTKKTQLWSEQTRLELRFEFFNAFNHTQFTRADLNLNNRTTFGKFIAARESRVIQLGARFSF